jgi:hypothetical protein
LALIRIKLMENRLSNHLEIRCPRLGGEVSLVYCLKEGGNIPCPRTILCWQPYFDVEAQLRANLTEEQWDRCFAKTPKEKIVSLVELIEAAKKRKQSEG